MSDIQITKISLTKGGKKEKEKLVISYQKKEPTGEGWFTVDNEEHTAPIHADFRQALNNLSIHYAILCGIVKEKEVKNIETPRPELIEDISINGFSLSGKENEKITITGTRKVPYGSTTINTPSQNLQSEMDNAYTYLPNLIEKIDRACEEGKSYLDGSKRGADPQQQLPFGEGQENGREVEAEEVEA